MLVYKLHVKFFTPGNVFRLGVNVNSMEMILKTIKMTEQVS